MSDIDNDQDLNLDQDQDQDQDENQDQDQDINNQDEDESGAGNGEGDGSSDEDENGDGGELPKKTDKGTKLDPNPMSALNQEYKNALSKVGRYEAVLNNPVMLRQYLAELEGEKGGNNNGGEEEIDISKLDTSKLETVEDIQEYAAKLQKGFQQKIAKIESQFTQGAQTQQIKDLGTKISNEVTEVQNQIPELRELNADGSKNPSFDPKLDDFIGSLYEEFDLDPKTKFFRGQIGFKRLATAIMSAVKYGETRASKKAGTVIVDKTHGRIMDKGGQGGNNGAQIDESKMSGAGLIGSRIARAASKIRR